MKKSHGKGSRKEPASNEDEAIWKYTAATIEPLKRGKPRVHVSDRVTTDTPTAKMPPPPQESSKKRAVLKHETVKPSTTAQAVASTTGSGGRRISGIGVDGLNPPASSRNRATASGRSEYQIQVPRRSPLIHPASRSTFR